MRPHKLAVLISTPTNTEFQNEPQAAVERPSPAPVGLSIIGANSHSKIIVPTDGSAVQFILILERKGTAWAQVGNSHVQENERCLNEVDQVL
jgi:hypothetical protein